MACKHWFRQVTNVRAEREARKATQVTASATIAAAAHKLLLAIAVKPMTTSNREHTQTGCRERKRKAAFRPGQAGPITPPNNIPNRQSSQQLTSQLLHRRKPVFAPRPLHWSRKV